MKKLLILLAFAASISSCTKEKECGDVCQRTLVYKKNVNGTWGVFKKEVEPVYDWCSEQNHGKFHYTNKEDGFVVVYWRVRCTYP